MCCSEIVIELDQITKKYTMGDEFCHVLKGINLTVLRNEFIAITGPSGSGKSTLMNILGCLTAPSTGTYKLAGENVAKHDENQLAHVRNHSIGFIFQSFNLLPMQSVLNNVMLPLKYRFMPNQDRKNRAKDVLEKVGLIDKLAYLPNQLSGGQRQRVAIARALVTEPKLLLGDEPTGNLDSKTTAEIMQLFDNLHNRGQTIVLVTHEKEIADHCQREIRLIDGKIVLDTQNNITDVRSLIEAVSC